MWKLLKKLRCKVFACFGSKCSINDTNNDGVPDQIIYESVKKEYTTDV